MGMNDNDYRKKPRGSGSSPIARARLDADLTQAQLAERIGVTPAQISNWETGFRRPKLEALKKIAEATGTTLEQLI